MGALPSAWLWLLLGLLSPDIQAFDLHRISSPRTSKYLKSTNTAVVPTSPDPSIGVTPGDAEVRRTILHPEPRDGLSGRLLRQSDGALWGSSGRSRGRRHANTGGGRGHGHLMRVGCVLGTCQVQNLSHRLYQLIGQSGRVDSSPVNPHSPHSYG